MEYFSGFRCPSATFFRLGRTAALSFFLSDFHSFVFGNGNWTTIDAGFAAPPAEFRLSHYSAHDGASLPVQQMAAAGIGGVQLFMQRDGYLQSEQAWDNVSNNIAEVKGAGLQLWVADDNGYPGGMAGGRVVEANPAHEARCLIEVKLDGSGIGPVSIALPAGAEKFVYAYLYPRVNGQPDLAQAWGFEVQDNVVTCNGRSGAWTFRAYALQINNQGTQALSTAGQFQTSGRYPNLLSPAAMDTFLSLTHEEYEERLGPLQGKINAFYSNEPNLMTLWWGEDPAERPGGVRFIPWDTGLPERFWDRHGYYLPEMLPALYGGTNTASKVVRRHFYDTVGAVLAENLSQRIAAWGDQNGVRTSGHPLQEEELFFHVIHYGDMFRFVEPMHIPACDLPMPDRGASWNYWMPKFLTSIAQYKNRPMVSGLLDPIIYRPQMNLTPLAGDFRRIVNMGALSGVNHFKTYLFWHLYDPVIYRGMNEYVGRLSLALRGARQASTVGLYYPIETFQANFLPSPFFWGREDLFTPEWEALRSMQVELDDSARNLSSAGIDFNWVHGDWLRDAVLDGGVLVVGPHRYSAIVLPHAEVLPLAVAQKLEQFRQAGGKVVLLESRPVLGDSASEHATVAALFSSQAVVAVANLVTELGPVVPPDFSVRVQPPVEQGATQEFFSARFVQDGRRITYLVNNGLTATAPTLTLAGGASGRVAVYNPLDGSITGHDLPGTLTIAPSSSLLVVENQATVPATDYQPLAVVNGDFSDRTGMNNTSTGWSGGFPPGWSGGANSAYAVFSLNGATYANLGELSSAAPFNPIAQNVGTVEATTDVRLTFTLANLQSGSSTVGVAIYGPGRANLGNASFTNAGTFTHTVRNVAPGTPVQIAFWGTSSGAPMGLTAVSVSFSTSSSGDVSVADGGILELSAVSPASITGNLVFGAGAKVRVTGMPSGPAVLLMSVAGSISGTPSLESPVAGYSLVAGGRWIWLRADGSSPLAVFNGNFDILTGMTGPLASVWYGGYPLGWTSGVAATDYSIYANGGLYYANLNTLGTSEATSLRQNIGTLELNSDVTLSFQVANPFPNSLNNSMGAAIFPVGSTTPLASYSLPSLSGVGASTNAVLKAIRVQAGTAISVGFWNTGGTAPAIREVSITSAVHSYDAWVASFGLDLATTGAVAADPDGDSLSNAVEYAFGTSPVNGAGEVIKTSALAGQFTIQWLQRVDGATSYTVQETGSLFSSWSASSAVVQAGSGSTPPTAYEWKKITVPLSDRRFYRVNAILSP